MDADLSELLEHWQDTWRFPRLWILLGRSDQLDEDLMRKYLLAGLASPQAAHEVWQELIDSGEFLAAERLLGCEGFRKESEEPADRLKDELDKERQKRAEPVRDKAWMVKRRAMALGLDTVAAAIDGIPMESLDSLPLAEGRLRDAEQEVEAGETQAFGGHTMDQLPRARNWPYGNTPTPMVLEWLRQEPGAPMDFTDWMPPSDDLGAKQLIGALWWMWKRKPRIDQEGVERFAIAFAQFLGHDPGHVETRDESWCIRASLPDLAPIWLPGLRRGAQARLDILVVDGEADATPPADMSPDLPCLLLDPFEVLERPPGGALVLSVPLLLRLMREDRETRAQILLGALGRQIEADRILPEAPIGGDGKPGSWPESDLADHFLHEKEGYKSQDFDETYRFLHRFFHYHGVRCGSAHDLDRIAFATACFPPLLRSFLRLLLGRTAGRRHVRPLRIDVGDIEQMRASEDWRRAAFEILLDPVQADPVARMVLLQFVFEFLMQDRLGAVEGNLEIDKDELMSGIEELVGKAVVDAHRLSASLDALRDLGLVFIAPDQTAPILEYPNGRGPEHLAGGRHRSPQPGGGSRAGWRLTPGPQGRYLSGSPQGANRSMRQPP